MHSIQQSKSRHNIFSKVDHDKTFLKQQNSNGSSSNLNSLMGASSSGAGGTFTPPIQSPIQRKQSGTTQSLFSPNATTVAIIAGGGVPTPTKGNHQIAPTTPGAPVSESSPLPNIDLNVRKRLAANDLAVKIAAKAPVLTPAAKMGRDGNAGGSTSGSGKPNINIFGVDEEDEYANLQIGYVESEYGDDIDDDVRSMTSNHSDRLEIYKRSRSSLNISKIRELPNEDDEDLAVEADDHHDDDCDDVDNDDDDFNFQEMSKTDPRQYKSPLDAHQKLMKMSKVKNRLKAIQALSSKKVIPTDEVLNEHKKTRLMIKSSAPTLKDTLSDYNTKFDKPNLISSKSKNSLTMKGEDGFEEDVDDDMSEIAAAPKLGSTPNKMANSSFFGGLSKSPSFRFLNSLTSGSKSPTSFLVKSFRSLGISDEDGEDNVDKSNANDNQFGGNNMEKGMSYQAPLDSVHKPIISRKLTSVTFNRFADGKKSLTDNPTTMLRVLDKMQNLHSENDENEQNAALTGENQKSAYHIPTLSKIEDQNNGKLMKRLDSWITKMTFVEAEKKPEPPPPTKKPDINIENVFGLDGLLIKADIPAHERIDDDEYDQLLGRTPQKRMDNPSPVSPSEFIPSPIKPSLEKNEIDLDDDHSSVTSSMPRLNVGEKVGRIRRGLSKRISFSNLNETEEKEIGSVIDADADSRKLAPYARALSRTTQSFISSFQQHKEKRDKENGKDEESTGNFQTPVKKPFEANVIGPAMSLKAISRTESPATASLPYDNENSNIKMIPRPHPLTSNSPTVVPVKLLSSPSIPKKSILKTNDSPKPGSRKTLSVADNSSPSSLTDADDRVLPSTPVSFDPPKVVVSSDDNLEFEYQFSTNSYVPKNYINHTELGIYDRHHPSPKSSQDEFFSERHLQEIEESTTGITQPVIYLPPDAYHVPVVHHTGSTASISGSTVGSSSIGGKNNVLIYNPNHSSSLRDLTNPLLLNTKGSRDKSSAVSSSLEASETVGGDVDPSIFDDGDDVVDEEFYPHLKPLLGPLVTLQPSRELHGSTVSSTQSSLAKVPHNEQIFKPGVVVTNSSFPQVIHNVVFPDNVAAQPHLVHYTAGMYQHVSVNPQSSEGDQQSNSSSNQQDSPLSALTRHHDKLSKQLAARHLPKSPANPPGSQLGNPVTQPATPNIVRDTPGSTSPLGAIAHITSPRIAVPPLTNMDSLHHQKLIDGPRRTSSTPSVTEDLKKKFMKSNPDSLHTASSVDLRDEILHFMKQSGSNMADQYEQYVDTTCKKPKRHRRDKQGGGDGSLENEQYDADENSSFMSDETDQRISAGNKENAMTMTGKMSLKSSFRSPTSQFQAHQTNGVDRIMSPTSQQQAYHRLKESLDKRYANDKEGEYHMKQKIKKYLHDGATEEYKVMRNYIDEIDDWK